MGRGPLGSVYTPRKESAIAHSYLDLGGAIRDRGGAGLSSRSDGMEEAGEGPCLSNIAEGEHGLRLSARPAGAEDSG
jgi:hypothetical protein